MLTLKTPIRVSLRPSMLRYHDDLSRKIDANYQVMASSLSPESMLHFMTDAAEVYMEGDSMTSLVSVNNRINRQHINVELINNVLNRILVAEENSLTYQDRTFIDMVLGRIGITDVKQFMHQVSVVKKNTMQVNRLIELYSKGGDVMKALQQYFKDSHTGQSKSETNITENIFRQESLTGQQSRIYLTDIPDGQQLLEYYQQSTELEQKIEQYVENLLLDNQEQNVTVSEELRELLVQNRQEVSKRLYHHKEELEELQQLFEYHQESTELEQKIEQYVENNLLYNREQEMIILEELRGLLIQNRQQISRELRYHREQSEQPGRLSENNQEDVEFEQRIEQYVKNLLTGSQEQNVTVSEEFREFLTQNRQQISWDEYYNETNPEWVQQLLEYYQGSIGLEQKIEQYVENLLTGSQEHNVTASEELREFFIQNRQQINLGLYYNQMKPEQLLQLLEYHQESTELEQKIEQYVENILNNNMEQKVSVYEELMELLIQNRQLTNQRLYYHQAEPEQLQQFLEYHQESTELEQRIEQYVKNLLVNNMEQKLIMSEELRELFIQNEQLTSRRLHYHMEQLEQLDMLLEYHQESTENTDLMQQYEETNSFFREDRNVMLSGKDRERLIQEEKVIREVIRRQQIRQQQTREILENYREGGDVTNLLLQYIEDYRSYDETKLVAMMQSLRNVVHELWMHQNILNRLETGAIYQEIEDYYRPVLNLNRSITTGEFMISEQFIQAKNISLNQIRNQISYREEPLEYRTVNTYEMGDVNRYQTNGDIVSELVEAVVLNAVNQAYALRQEQVDAHRNNWYDLTESIQQTIQNTMSRFEQFHEKSTSVYNEADVYNKVMQRNITNEITALEKLYEQHRENRINHEQSIQTEQMLYRDETVIHGQQVNYLTQQEEMLAQQLNEINLTNQHNQERLEKVVKEMKSEPRLQINRAKAMEDARRAIEEPQKVMLEYMKQENVVERYETMRQEQLSKVVDKDVLKIFEQIEQYHKNPERMPQNITVNNIALESLIHDTTVQMAAENQQTPAHTEKETQEFTHHTEREEIRSQLERIMSKETAQVQYRQTPGKIELLHKKAETDVNEELLEEIRNVGRTVVKRTQQYDEEIEDTQDIHRTVTNRVNQIQLRNNEEISSVIAGQVRDQIGSLSEQVYRRLEKRMDTEKRRRGL